MLRAAIVLCVNSVKIPNINESYQAINALRCHVNLQALGSPFSLLFLLTLNLLFVVDLF